MRLAEATIEHLDWRTCLARYDRPHTLFFADPPYWETEGYGVDFPLSEYDALAEAARTCKGRLVITVNDHPAMRQAFAGLPLKGVPITYTVGGGQNSVERQELIIGNWPDGWPPERPLTSQLGLGEAWV